MSLTPAVSPSRPAADAQIDTSPIIDENNEQQDRTNGSQKSKPLHPLVHHITHSTSLQTEDEEIYKDMSVDEALDAVGFGKFQIRLIILGSICWAGDAMEILLLSFLIPALKNDWDLPPNFDGLLGAVVFIGILVGNYAWGLISDRYGRRVGFTALSSIVGVFGFLSAFSPSIHALLVFRFLVGFGLGASPVAFALVTEYLPTKYRAKILVLSSIFWSIGAIFEAALAWIIIPRAGWRVFLAVSSIPMWILLGLTPFVPESLHFLHIKGKAEEASQLIEQIISFNNKQSSVNRKIQLKTSLQPRLSVFSQLKILLQNPLIRTTACLWSIWFVDSFSYYGVTFLTPRFFGVASSDQFEYIFISTLAEFPSVLFSYLTIDRFGRKMSLIVSFAFAAFPLLILTIMSSTQNVGAVILLFLSRMMISSAYNVTYIYTSEVYPTIIRTTALGGASAMARIAGITTSFISEDVGTNIATGLFGFSALIATLVAMMLPFETADRNLPESLDEVLELADVKSVAMLKNEDSGVSSLEKGAVA